ncbi:MAG: outer membrane beta-barrel protein [Cytophagales bacterium]|nr:outer membrane beta-barrel protein [Cytophagales bacterium]
MLRKLHIIGIVTFTVNDVFAQIDYGVKAVLNHVNVVRTDLTTNFRKHKQSFHLGGYVNLNLGDELITQVELLYSNKGYKNDTNSVTEIGHTNLNYINMPVLLRYQLFNKVSFSFGPEFGYLISAFRRDGDIKQSQK